MSDSVIAALLAAIQADPAQLDLRRHVAELLQSAGRHEEALEHGKAVLAEVPDDLNMLRLAEACARAIGNSELANRYGRMARALGASAQALDLPPIGGFPQEPEPERLTLRRGPGGGGEVPAEVERPGLTLEDVAGLESVKERIELAFLGPLRNPEFRKAYGKSLKGGMLLYGPPGCGKTYLARAIAGEMGMQFISVGIEDVLDMYIGESEKQLHELFESARRISPCVIFLDEVDALGRKRSLQRQSCGSTIVNQLLAELDGIKEDNEGIFLIAATNHPWDVDSALRRPGRLDRTLFVPPPDEPARLGVLNLALRDRPVANLDLAKVARTTEGFSGADLTHVVESAAELAMAEAVKAGRVIPLSMNHLERALKDVKPSTRIWLDTAKNYALFANDGGSYDDLAAYLRGRRLI